MQSTSDSAFGLPRCPIKYFFHDPGV